MIKFFKIINYLLVGIIALIFLFSCSSQEKYLTTKEKVVLRGKLVVETFLDANDQPEGAYILILDRPINVAEDINFGGPEKNVTEVQLAFSFEEYKKARQCVNKKLKAKGYLYYSFSAHHHKRILLNVEEFTCK